MKKIITVVGLALLATACASKKEIVTAQDLQHHHWVLAKIDGDDVQSKNKRAQSDLEIGENLYASGLAGCNRFHGQAEINPDNGKFRIKQMGMTMKMCTDPFMNIERAVATSLSSWNEIDLGKDTLTLSNDQHTLTYTLSEWVN